MNDIAAETVNATITLAATPADTPDVIRMTWKPSSDQMAMYKTREVALCVQTIQRGAATAQLHTLYSQRTWDAAIEQLGGRLPEIPPHIIKSLETMREMAAAAASSHIKFGKNGFARR